MNLGSQRKMQQLITYLGGKQRIAKKIYELFPPHDIYVEPFAGGASLLFTKPKLAPPKKEVINDKNGLIATLYRVARDNPEELRRLIELTAYSEAEFKLAKRIQKNWEAKSDLDVAWAMIVACNQGFAADLGSGGWAFCRTKPNEAIEWNVYQKNLSPILSRLEGVYVSSKDALVCIPQWDTPSTLFYCDPPYPQTYQKGYSHGYTIADFIKLVEVLNSIKGSFILSCYDNVEGFIPPQWEKIEMTKICASSKSSRQKRTECLWIKTNKIEEDRDDQLKIFQC